MLIGCGDAGRTEGWSNPGAMAHGTAGPCVDGQKRGCTVPLAVHNDVKHCFAGQQTCESGSWGPCGEPDEDPSSEAKNAPQPKALGAATACDDNPCAPTCQQFDENPVGGVAPDRELVGTFYGGEITSIPPGFIGHGMNEPCSSNQDCQFDHYCSSPTSGSCAHSKCATGDALELGCDDAPFIEGQDSCVDAICEIDPACCGQDPPPPGTCEHQPPSVVCRVSIRAVSIPLAPLGRRSMIAAIPASKPSARKTRDVAVRSVPSRTRATPAAATALV